MWLDVIWAQRWYQKFASTFKIHKEFVLVVSYGLTLAPNHANIKTPAYQYRNTHYKNKTASQLSYPYHGNPYNSFALIWSSGYKWHSEWYRKNHLASLIYKHQAMLTSLDNINWLYIGNLISRFVTMVICMDQIHWCLVESLLNESGTYMHMYNGTLESSLKATQYNNLSHKSIICDNEQRFMSGHT